MLPARNVFDSAFYAALDRNRPARLACLHLSLFRAIWRIILQACGKARKFVLEKSGAGARTSCCAGRDRGPSLYDFSAVFNVTIGSYLASRVCLYTIQNEGSLVLCVARFGSLAISAKALSNMADSAMQISQVFAIVCGWHKFSIYIDALLERITSSDFAG